MTVTTPTWAISSAESEVVVVNVADYQLPAVLGIDVETASVRSIKEVGAEAYAGHPSTKVLCAVFALSFFPDKRTVYRWTPGARVPPAVVTHVGAGGPVLAHNANFERAVIKHILRPQHGWPTVPRNSWQDTAAVASALGLPTKLEGLAPALGCKHTKDMEGNALMLRLSQAEEDPETGGYIYPPVSPAELERLLDYCEGDVLAMLDSWWRLPKLIPFERRLMQVDQRINARGILLDQPLARAMHKIARARIEELDTEVFDITGELLSVAAEPMKRYLKHRIELPRVKRRGKDGKTVEKVRLNKLDVDKLLEDPSLPKNVRAVLALRAESSKATSIAKLQRVPLVVSPDGRLRGALRFCAAHTGRWASEGVQLHNLPKVPKDVRPHLDAMREAVHHGNVELLRKHAPNAMQALSWLLRSVVMAAPGHDFIGGDYSAIEARVICWLAGQHDVLQMFADGEDVYTAAAVRAGSDNRDLGKVQVLGLGYGMGPLKFAGQALSYGVQLELKEAKRIHGVWRAHNSRITEFWLALERAAISAVQKPGIEFEAGKLCLHATKSVLRLRLPSGRCLHYWRPHVVISTRTVQTVEDDGTIVERELTRPELRFHAEGPDRSSMVKEHTYGGKLAENATQATARDLMACALDRLDMTDYHVVLHVHDSVLAEVPEGTGDTEEFASLMTTIPSWARGLPVAVDVYRGKRFKG